MKVLNCAGHGLTIIFCMSLTACVHRPIEESFAAIFRQSCEGIPNPKPGFTFKTAGLEIPYKPNGPIKVGSLNFNRDDGIRLSDAIFAMGETRQSQCAYLAAALLGNPKPSGERIMQSLDGIKATRKQADDVVTLLKTQGADPTKVAEIAEAGATNAVKALEKLKEKLAEPSEVTPGKIGLSNLTDDLIAKIERFRDIDSVRSSLVTVQADLAEMRKAAPYRAFKVTGFDVGGVTLTAEMKTILSLQYTEALASAAPRVVSRVSIVGFADSTGIYLRNVDIGLQRATNVAAYLERNFPKAAEIKMISSGGVLANDQQARRVDVLIL